MVVETKPLVVVKAGNSWPMLVFGKSQMQTPVKAVLLTCAHTHALT